MTTIPSPSGRQPSMANRLRSQDVAALQRALDSQRLSARSAQDRAKELQQALDGERSAVRALRREAAAHERSVREEEGRKYSDQLEQLKNKLELAKIEALAAEKENTTRILSLQFQRELHNHEEQWRRETKRQLDFLQEQLKATQQRQLEAVTPQSQTEALVHSLHADFQRTLRQKQDEWRDETNAQVDSLANQLRDLQRLHSETCSKLTTITNEAETIPKLRQELQTLRLQNKEMEEKLAILAEADRKKVEEFRALHESNAQQLSEFQKAARKETFRLVEEMKSKDRTIAHLQRECGVLATRLESPSSRHSSPRPLGSQASMRVSVC